jgi:hypothetical protein
MVNLDESLLDQYLEEVKMLSLVKRDNLDNNTIVRYFHCWV